MVFTINFSKTLGIKADTAIVGVYQDKRLSPPAEKLNKETGGLIQHHLNSQKNFTGKSGQTLALAAPKDSAYTYILLAGYGEPSQISAQTAETIGGKLFPALRQCGSTNAVLFVDDDQAREQINTADFAAHVAMGLKLRFYEFDKYKTGKSSDEDEEQSQSLASLSVVGDKAPAAETIFEPLACAAEGVFLARDLVNEPPNRLYPESFAKIIREELKPLGVEVEVIDEKKMERLGFHAHLAVGKGSERPPRVVIMRWRGTKKTDRKDKGPLAFVGKGVTFDTGGYNLKPGSGMGDMKCDMAGAAAVTGLMKTLALRKAEVDVIAVAGLAENMISHGSYRPSDIIPSMSGKNIEVLNTDAEGRLVLIDCLTYVQRTYKPRLVVDLATLTGAMMVALGFEYCGIFANSDDLWEQFEQAGRVTGEKLWRMPLDEAYRKEMDSQIADAKTVATNGRYAGACTAAGFLEKFIENERPWAHLDIAGVAWIKADRPTCPKPATGFGVRVMDQLIRDNYEN